ncbi:YVTN family beta-propeller repeat protein [Elioraea thermophila]|uniref:YVTN family beta-propeller repeat protein n=1 Tax=Elioraea thermophila TaxID=2185104 RepID=UPI000DF32975|nr:PQQ-binding-like beta-propeller repeat protein [Elioraea thermophila]
MHRRTLLATALAAALPLSPARAGAGHAGNVFVLDSRDATVSVIDAARGEVVKRIPTLREPHHLVYTPDRSEIVLGDSVGNEFLFLHPARAETTRTLRISNPYHLMFSPDGAWLTVASLRRNQIDLYRAADYGLVHRLAAPRMPSHIAWSSDSRVTFVTLQGTNDLVAIEAETGRILWRKPTGDTPAGILRAASGELLVANMGEETVSVIDPETGETIRRIRTGAGAHNVFPSPDGRVLFVTNRVAGTISILDARSFAVLGAHRAPGAPDCLDFSPDGRQIWFTQRVSNRVGVLEVESGALLAQIRVGRSPHGILFHALA